MLTEVLILLALVAINGLFSGAEIAVLTAKKAGKDRRALAVTALREQPERFLATVQIGITVVGAAAAAYGGSSLASDLAPYLAVFGERADQVALVIIVATVSFLSLVLGELVPKSLALRYASGYAMLIGRPMLRLSQLMRPLVWFLTACSNVVLKMFGDKTSFTETRASREEIREMVAEAARTGSVDERSSEIASRALEFGDVTIAEIMVLRERIAAVKRGSSVEEVQQVFVKAGHSRMPVYDGDLDQIIGYVVARDVLALAWEKKVVTIDDIIRPLIKVPLAARLTNVLREMQIEHIQIAVVVDDIGATAGIVTIEDIVEELVGDIADETEAHESPVRIQKDGTVLVPGWVPTRKVNRLLGMALPIEHESTTIAGLCMTTAQMVPEVGSKLTVRDGTQLEIVEASAKRVRLVRILRAQS